MADFNNKNTNGGDPGNGQRLFWHTRPNANNTFFYAHPDNLLGFVDIEAQASTFLHKLLDGLGMDKLWKQIEPMFDLLTNIAAAFHIPADADDSGANLAVGALLRLSNSPLYSIWDKSNQNCAKGYVDTLVKYSYEPFHKDENSSKNVIDPRTYFFMHKYLEGLSSSGQTNVSLITTWMLSIEEEKVFFPLNYSMPENVRCLSLSLPFSLCVCVYLPI